MANNLLLEHNCRFYINCRDKPLELDRIETAAPNLI
jgi:hypothetical protein